MKKLLLTALLSASVAFPLYAQQPDPVMVKVGSEEIKKSEVDEVWKSIFPGNTPPAFDTFDAKVKDNVLRGIASERLLYKEAEKTDIKNSPEVKARLAAVEHQVVIREFLKEKTKAAITDDKLKAAYAERVKAAGSSNQEELRARHILVETENEAKEIEKKLKKGGNFEAIAKEKSKDKTSGANGGDLGYFTTDKMVPEFSKAAAALKKGEISAPVKSDFGWHIIKLEDRRKAAAPSFEESKDALSQELSNKAVNDYVVSLTKDVKIFAVDAAGKERELTAPAAPAPAATPAPAAAK